MAAGGDGGAVSKIALDLAIGATALSVLTWNVNKQLSTRWTAISERLSAAQMPDVICFQEAGNPGEHAKGELKLKGYTWLRGEERMGQDGRSMGDWTAICVKEPAHVESNDILLEGRAQAVKLTKGRVEWAIVCYYATQIKTGLQLHHWRKIRRWAEAARRKGRRVLIVGDFNRRWQDAARDDEEGAGGEVIEGMGAWAGENWCEAGDETKDRAWTWVDTQKTDPKQWAKRRLDLIIGPIEMREWGMRVRTLETHSHSASDHRAVWIGFTEKKKDQEEDWCGEEAIRYVKPEIEQLMEWKKKLDEEKPATTMEELEVQMQGVARQVFKRSATTVPAKRQKQLDAQTWVPEGAEDLWGARKVITKAMWEAKRLKQPERLWPSCELTMERIGSTGEDRERWRLWHAQGEDRKVAQRLIRRIDVRIKGIARANKQKIMDQKIAELQELGITDPKRILSGLKGSQGGHITCIREKQGKLTTDPGEVAARIAEGVRDMFRLVKEPRGVKDAKVAQGRKIEDSEGLVDPIGIGELEEVLQKVNAK